MPKCKRGFNHEVFDDHCAVVTLAECGCRIHYLVDAYDAMVGPPYWDQCKVHADQVCECGEPLIVNAVCRVCDNDE